MSDFDFAGFTVLTGECPYVTVRYEQKKAFFNPKLYQIFPKIAKFLPFFNQKYPKNVWAFPY